ncbi:Carbamate kinase [Tritrichomonas foetus]|uniref:Carbamate kinase n=1 Tax=Tritrichomonas foetus TaxID=1144522 RepID=A0A1J4L0J5_9EUKA|nr:Carbamate kinase [Tritrichomonas foetus]|eukprot:OHT17023.1 Carbamate kinase [Tritrichomonas foetus]
MKIVIALGGNALLQRGMRGTFEDQQQAARVAMAQIVQLVKNGNELVVTHGNGPQCGAIFLQNVNSEPAIPAMPLHVCGAMSQGFLGEMLQQELEGALKKEGIQKKVVSIVTQSYVDPKDPAFQNPTKPIGQFYTKEVADQMQKEKGYNMIEDSGRGWRIIVPSPVPISFVEQDAIKCLVNNGFIVVCSGGGGIPVIDENGMTKGVEAVIDKDLGASVLAEVTDSEAFMILTDVKEAMINFRKPDQKELREETVAQMEEYIKQGQFASGSMLPKVQACIRFVKRTNKPAIITSLDHCLEALDGKCGTKIVP